MRRFASALAAVSSVCAVVFLLTAVPINALLPTPQHNQLVECQRKAWKDLSACPKNTTYVKDSGELQIALYYDNSSAIILKSDVEYRGRYRAARSVVIAGEMERGAVPLIAIWGCGNPETDDTSTLAIVGEGTNVLMQGVMIRNECDDQAQSSPQPPDESQGNGPAVWVGPGASATILDSQIYGWRGTLAVFGRAYVNSVDLQGWLDWIYGSGRLYISTAQIAPRGKGNIVAWDSSVSNGAVVIRQSTVGPAPHARKDLTAGSVSLARPWTSDTTSIWLNTELFDIVKPSLWSAYGYASNFINKQRGIFAGKGFRGKGYDPAQVNKKLDSSDTINFSQFESEEAFFGGDTEWIEGPKLEWPKHN